MGAGPPAQVCLLLAPREGHSGGSSWEHSHPMATRKGAIEFEANLQGFEGRFITMPNTCV